MKASFNQKMSKLFAIQFLIFAILLITQSSARRNNFIYKNKIPNKVKLVQFQSRQEGKLKLFNLYI